MALWIGPMIPAAGSRSYDFLRLEAAATISCGWKPQLRFLRLEAAATAPAYGPGTARTRTNNLGLASCAAGTLTVTSSTGVELLDTAESGA